MPEISLKAFNPKIESSLVGTIVGVSDSWRLLYANLASRWNPNWTWMTEPSPENYSSNDCSSDDCAFCHSGVAGSDIDPERMIAPELSLRKGAVLLWAGTDCGPVKMIRQLAGLIGIDEEKPLAEQDRRFVDILLYGYGEEPILYVHNGKQKIGCYRGCVNDLKFMREAGTTSKGNLRAIRYFSGPVVCKECNGSRLRLESRHIRIHGLSIVEALQLPVPEMLSFLRDVSRSVGREEGSDGMPLIEAIQARLEHLQRIGLQSLRL
ncbi:hypothetical protein [Cohnella thailandensis]|nr:hypothetical protein [Cohnella thailandensis]